MKATGSAAIILALMLAACQHLHLPDTTLPPPKPAADRPASRPDDPVLAFVSTAAPGQATRLEEPGRGPVEIRLEREYFSADAIVCRRFTLFRGPDIQTRVACRSAAGWQLDPVLGNPAPR